MQTNDSLVVVECYDNSMTAEIAKSVLDSAGIFSVIHGEVMSMLYNTGAFPSRLMVKAEDYDEAKKLLEASQL